MLADANKHLKFIDDAYSMAITEPKLIDTTIVAKDITELKAPLTEVAEACHVYPWFCFESLSAKGYESLAAIVHKVDPTFLGKLYKLALRGPLTDISVSDIVTEEMGYLSAGYKMVDCYKIGTNPNKVCVWTCRSCGNSFSATKIEIINADLATASKNKGSGLNLLSY